MDDGPDVLIQGDESDGRSSRVPGWRRRRTGRAIVLALGIAVAAYGAQREGFHGAAEAARGPVSLKALLLPPDVEAIRSVTPGRRVVPFPLRLRNDGRSPVRVREVFIVASGVTVGSVRPRPIGPGDLRLLPLILRFRCPVSVSYVSDLSVRVGAANDARTVLVPFDGGIGYVSRLAKRACREPEPRNVLAFRYLRSHVHTDRRAVRVQVRVGNGWSEPVTITRVESRAPGMRVTVGPGSTLPLRVPPVASREFTLTWHVDDCRVVRGLTPSLVRQDLTVRLGDGRPEPVDAVSFGDRYGKSVLDLASRVCDGRLGRPTP